MEITKHFTTSVYIVCNNKVLLHKHKKLNLILPLGGHIDRDQLPHETAIKEAKEESGLDIELYNSNKLKENHFKDGSKELNRGEHLNLHNINPYHQHIDFIYYAKSKTQETKPQKGESKQLNWFSKEEIEKSTYLLDTIKYYALEALELLKDE